MTAIYFDLDGTLVRYERTFGEIFGEACDDVGVEPPDGALEYYTGRFFDHFAAFADDPYLEAARDLRREYGFEFEGAAFSEAYLEAERDATALAPGVEDALSALAEDHSLGVLSNGIGSVQRGKLEGHGIADRFDAVVISHEVGAAKPDPRIFTVAKERLPAEWHVYVGDSRDDDIVPANEAGFETAYVGDRGDETGADHCLEGEFSRLSDVL